MSRTRRILTFFLPGRRHEAADDGFSLIEVIVVMWLVGALMLVGTATLLGALRVFEASNVVHQRMAQRQTLAAKLKPAPTAASTTVAPGRIRPR